jgi:long-chain fatty acid transport protein
MNLGARYATGVTALSLDAVLTGEDTAFGFTAGINWLPAPGTSIGLGYRSAIIHTLDGRIAIPGSPVLPANDGAGTMTALDTPDIVTLSARHHITKQLKALATVEWAHWNRLKRIEVVCSNTPPNAVFCPAGSGQLSRSVALNWHDSWMFAGGLEYDYSRVATLRGGIAYERSPIQNATERMLGNPDVDRLTASLGASFHVSKALVFDIAYSHVFGIGNGDVSRLESGVLFTGNSRYHADIVSLSAKVKFQP